VHVTGPEKKLMQYEIAFQRHSAMTNMLKLTCAACMLFHAPCAFCGDIYVIANPSSTLSPTDIKDVYSGAKQTDSGTMITPFDNASLKAEFVDRAMHMTVDKYSALWAKRAFRDGLNPPGAIGYVSRVPPDMKVILKYENDAPAK
jgi:hypothetical protein